MSFLRLLASAARRAPAALALGYAEATDKIKFTLVLPIKSSVFTSTDVVQVNICAATGDMGILANHVLSIEPLRPSIVEVIESTGSKKWFGALRRLRDGAPRQHAHRLVEAALVEDFSAEAIRTILQEALCVAAGNGSEEDKLEARIEADAYEALQHAVST
ncbi:hypothetical protein B0H17DRAFT_1216101 [Mycena rosella]|uniref:ATP synthase subunit delta, mitochondrial n=1 Tax=Mycena rosella TaxID=1033263 RepID=A0AAD7FVM1_MYCRO|nr:hypothetical protein B0H17DRAFT_1216101 [Mycena rosella]